MEDEKPRLIYEVIKARISRARGSPADKPIPELQDPTLNHSRAAYIRFAVIDLRLVRRAKPQAQPKKR